MPGSLIIINIAIFILFFYIEIDVGLSLELKYYRYYLSISFKQLVWLAPSYLLIWQHWTVLESRDSVFSNHSFFYHIQKCVCFSLENTKPLTFFLSKNNIYIWF